jgi:hypothetical protein
VAQFRPDCPLYLEAGTICETGKTDENAIADAHFWSVVEQIDLLTGLTGLHPFPFSL